VEELLTNTTAQIEVQSNTIAFPGWTPWYEIHIDPENAGNLMLCGSKWDAHDNAFYGFVYSSPDGGKTWQAALEEKSSTWVTEHSCAFGLRGLAYFVSDASRVIDGVPHHDLGTTRIYVSHDSAKTWRLGTTTGWTDWSTSVVDTSPGPNQNRLYVFFNSLTTFYNSIGSKQEAKEQQKGEVVGLISYKDGDARVAGPYTNMEIAKDGYRGTYPAPSFVLKDGSIMAFFTANRWMDKGSKEFEFMVGAVHSDSQRTALNAPVSVVRSSLSLANIAQSSATTCNQFYADSMGGAYDAEHDKFYFVYADEDVLSKKCSLWLTTSGDGGKTWSKGWQLRSTDDKSEHGYFYPAAAINKDGVLAVTWEEKFRSGCWMFAVSTDDGRSLSRAQELGTCKGEATKPSSLSSAYLFTTFFPPNRKDELSTSRINLRNARNRGGPHEHAIEVTPDGAFHFVWIDAGNGEGEVRTATVRVTTAASMIAVGTHGLQDVTSKVTLLYGGNQFYDLKSGILALDVMVKNNSDQPLKGPLKLAVPSLYKDYGFAEIANADNKATGAGAMWDLTVSMPDGVLAPNATSRPFRLKFRYAANTDTPRYSEDILGLSVRVFAVQ
jgi:hypothetical protein